MAFCYLPDVHLGQIYLAMELKETAGVVKATQLISSFKDSFLDVQSTFHPSGVRGEIAGKSSNVAFAAQRIIEVHRPALQADDCKVVVTVMDGLFSFSDRQWLC